MLIARNARRGPAMRDAFSAGTCRSPEYVEATPRIMFEEHHLDRRRPGFFAFGGGGATMSASRARSARSRSRAGLACRPA
jgi:hypothetical protein